MAGADWFAAACTYPCVLTCARVLRGVYVQQTALKEKTKIPTKVMAVHIMGEDSRHRPKPVELVSRANDVGKPATLPDYKIRSGTEIFVENRAAIPRGQRSLAAQEIKRREKLIEVIIKNTAVVADGVPGEFSYVCRTVLLQPPPHTHTHMLADPHPLLLSAA